MKTTTSYLIAQVCCTFTAPNFLPSLPGALDTDAFTQARLSSIHITHFFPCLLANSRGSECAPVPPT